MLPSSLGGKIHRLAEIHTPEAVNTGSRMVVEGFQGWKMVASGFWERVNPISILPKVLVQVQNL